MTSFLIPHRLVNKLRDHIRTTDIQKEQGGLLLGHRKPEAIELCHVSFPSPWDYGSPTRFHRSERGHRIKALREWLISKHTVDWVGEWHTHPGGRADPSAVDLKTWFHLTRHQAKPMVFMILSDRDMYLGLHDGMQINRLSAIECDDRGTLYD